jgi:DNA-binding GntR family transcriptional regulator
MRGVTVLKSLDIKPLRDQAADAIRDAIIGGALAPGDRIPEQELAEQLGVSRVPIREAIRILEQQGLVVVQPKSGTLVAKLTLEQLYDGLCVRAALEEWAVRQAFGRSDCAQWEAMCHELEAATQEMRRLVVGERPDFAAKRAEAVLDVAWHARVVQASRNETLILAWRNAAWLTRIMMRNTAGAPSAGEWAATIHHHEDLLEIMRRRNLAECLAATRQHVLRRACNLLGVPVPLD